MLAMLPGYNDHNAGTAEIGIGGEGVIKYRINKKKVERLMAKSKLNQTDLAYLMGVTKQSVSRMLIDGGEKCAQKLAKILDCNPKDLIEVKR
jgi:DNA-binding Xre family transcriptional regulator